MSQRLLVPLCLLILAAVGLWWLQSGDAEDPGRGQQIETLPGVAGDPNAARGREQAPEAVEPTRVEGGRREAAGGAVGSEREDPPSYRRALAKLRGRILWEHDQSPVAHTEVQCLELRIDAITPQWSSLLEQSWDFDPLRGLATTRTDAEGRFELPGVHSRGMLVLLIGLRTEAQAVRLVDDGPMPGEDKDLGDIALQQRGGVRGQILDPEGRGIAGVRVRVADLPGIVMQAGVGRFDPKGVIAFVEGKTARLVQIPGWVERRFDDLPFPMAITDAEGSFELRGARPGRAQLIVHAAQYPVRLRGVRIRAGEVQDLSPTKLRAGETLRGTVKDQNGEPVPGAWVTAGALVPMVPVAPMPPPIQSDEEGRFEIRGLGRGKLIVAYRGSEKGSWSAKGPLRLGEEVSLTLPARHTYRLALVDLKNRPVDGARIAVGERAVPAEVPIPGLTRWLGPEHVRPDEEEPGQYLLEDLSGMQHVVAINAEGLAAQQIEIQPQQQKKGSSQVVTLMPATELRVEVRGPGNEPVHAARVFWIQRRSRRGSENLGAMTRVPVLLGKTDAEGVLISDSVEIGASEFYARHPAYGLGKSGEQVLRQGGAIRIRLARAGRIDGRVLENGKPLADSRMLLLEPRRELWREMREMMTPEFTASRPDGSFSFGGLHPGTYRVQVLPRMGGLNSPMGIYQMARRMEGGRRPPRVEVDVAAGGVARVEIETVEQEQVKGSGRILGTVLVDGKPPTDTLVRLRGKSAAIAEVDAHGAFEFAGLADGNYRLELRKGDEVNFQEKRLGSASVEVKDGLAVPVRFDVRTARFELTVLDAEGQVLPGRLVRLTGRSFEEKGSRSLRDHATTNAQGVAVFSEIPAGTYEARLEGGPSRDLVFGDHEFELRAGAVRRARLQAETTFSLEGTVEFVLDDLTEEQRVFLGDPRPGWLGGQQGGRWVRIRFERDAKPMTFRAEGVASGRFFAQTWTANRVHWRTEDIQVRAGLQGVVLRLRPDKKQLEQVMKAEEEKKRKAAQGGK